jgi:hypothetical protein
VYYRNDPLHTMYGPREWRALWMWEELCAVNVPDIMTHEEMFAGSPIVVGAQYLFDYPVEFISLPEFVQRYTVDTLSLSRQQRKCK